MSRIVMHFATILLVYIFSLKRVFYNKETLLSM